MKKNTIKKVLALSAILALAAAAAGCSEKKVQEPIEDPIEVTISIDFPDGAEAEDITEEAFLVEDGTTVLDALQIYCNVNDIPVNVETTAAAVYGINGINNSDDTAENPNEEAEADDEEIAAETETDESTETALTGSWHYSVNGEESSAPENEVRLSDGDSIIWIYQ
jgi:hypothetical protein